MTQKQLADQLHISDKAVSKWETGISIPDTALLIPLVLLAVGLLVPGWLEIVAYVVMSVLFLLGLFVPIYIVGKKYE